MAATLPTKRVTIMDGDGNEAEIDEVAQSLIGIDFAHHEIHEGNHYFVSGYTELDTDGALTFCLTTNSTTQPHMTWSITTSAKGNVVVYEGSTIAGGAAVTAINSDRDSSNTSTVTIVSNPTVNSTGTLIASSGMGGGTKQNPLGSDGTHEEEIMLAKSTVYQWTITSEADNNVIDYIGSWYEPD